jgi:hypothetical protein
VVVAHRKQDVSKYDLRPWASRHVEDFPVPVEFAADEAKILGT